MLRNLVAASPAGVCFTAEKQIMKGGNCLLAPYAEGLLFLKAADALQTLGTQVRSENPSPSRFPAPAGEGLLGSTMGCMLGTACRAFLRQARRMILCRIWSELMLGF